MRTVFFISDGTGITAETLGRSLLSQFETVSFECTTIPYVNTKAKAKKAIAQIKKAVTDTERPIIFATIINPDISEILHQSPALMMDFFQTFISPLENELQQQSSHKVGRLHGVKSYTDYMARINAVNYALGHDDGVNTRNYKNANIILVGVSRCGKTPTCLYLALQFGIYAANYPLTEEDMQTNHLPEPLIPYQNKLFGLTIDPLRLQKIRQERRGNSDYASLHRCEFEIRFAETLFLQHHITWLDTTSRSIEEIAAEIMTMTDLKRWK